MLKAYKYRIMPTKAQVELINKHIGSCRFVYNLALETKQNAYAGNKTNLSRYDLQAQLPDLKKECVWLKEINSQSLQVSLLNLENSFIKFYNGQADFPKFKKKSDRQSFNIPQNIVIDIERNQLILPKFRRGIDIILHRTFKGIIKQATISKTSTDKYFVSIVVENNIIIPNKVNIESNNTIGIDLGLKSFLITSGGEKFNNSKFLRKSESRLKYIQCKYSKYNGKRTRRKLVIIHEIVANQRKDFLNKLSTKLISENQTICLEDLNIKGMLAKCKPKQNENGRYLPNGQSAKSGLNKSIHDASWGMFVDMLKYKAEWQGKNILEIDRFEPSSKCCNVCGTINKELTLKNRVWTCNNCNTVHDRDINAAINIKKFALRNYIKNIDLCKGLIQENHEKLSAVVEAMTHEVQPSLVVE
jgi:putative transposase